MGPEDGGVFNLQPSVCAVQNDPVRAVEAGRKGGKVSRRGKEA